MSSAVAIARTLWVTTNQRLDTAQVAMAARSPVRAHIFVMALLFTAAAVVGYVLLPGDAERIAMLERDGKTIEARQILEQQFNAGDRRQRTLFLLEGLYEQSGNLPKAGQTLELLAEQRPRDANVQRQLGQFYKLTHAEPAYIKTLWAQLDLRYSEPACRELIGLLRRGGQYAEEQSALIKCRQKGYRRPDDMVRLASLLAVDGDIKEASFLLRAVDDLRRLKSDRERLQLFELLIENDQPGEAQRRASRWVKTNKDDGFTLTLISELAAANRPDLAIELARETSVPGDSIFLSIGELMADRDQTVAAQSILRGWLDKAPSEIEPSVAGRFINAAVSSGDPDLALAGAQKAGLARIPADAAAILVRSFETSNRRADAEALRASLHKLRGPDATDAIEAPLPGRRPTPVAKSTGLEPWRNALWKRLREENKTVAANQAGAKPARAARDLQALKRARKYRRLPNAKTKQQQLLPGQPSEPFNFFTKP